MSPVADMSPVAEDEIVRMTEEIWLSTLNFAPHRRPPEAPMQLEGLTLDGVVHISGEWRGAVTVQFSPELAARVAARMYRLGDATPSMEELVDALGEVTNITGGNIKACIPGECSLSLPTVVEGTGYHVRFPGSRVVNRVEFECEGLAFVVSLLKEN